MNNKVTVSTKFGQNVSPIENGNVELYPLHIWDTERCSALQESIANEIRKVLKRQCVLHKMDVGGVGGAEHEVYGVRQLPNINTVTNVITRYQLTNDELREVVGELLLDASDCGSLAMS